MNLHYPIVAKSVAAEPATEPAPTIESNSDAKRPNAYPFPDIETKWQAYWLKNKTFRTPEDIDMSKPKYYVLDMFPYPRQG